MNLFHNSYSDDQIIFVQSIFAIEGPVPFSALRVGDIFMVPGTKATNRYWKTKQNQWRPYSSPIVCRKEGPLELVELMTDFPVPNKPVLPDKIHILAYPCRFISDGPN